MSPAVRRAATLLVLLMPAFTFGAEPLRLLETPEAWTQSEGPEGAYTFEAGELAIHRTDRGPTALVTVQDFENFELGFEFVMPGWCETNLFFGAPRHGAHRAGFEVRLGHRIDDPLDEFTSGSLFRHRAPDSIALQERGVWNTFWMRFDWPRLTVTINEETLHDLDVRTHDGLRHRLRRGALGFANAAGSMRIRGFALTPLPDSEHGIRMFDGETFEGWEIVPGGGTATWEVLDGALRGENGNAYLLYETVCQDFDLRLHYRSSADANGGVFFRWERGEDYASSSRGQEIQIWDLPNGGMPSGSVYGIARGNDLAFQPGAWNHLRVIVRGSHAITYINGIRSAETDAVRVVRPGQICLQMHRSGAWVDYKDLVLVPLD